MTIPKEKLGDLDHLVHLVEETRVTGGKGADEQAIAQQLFALNCILLAGLRLLNNEMKVGGLFWRPPVG